MYDCIATTPFLRDIRRNAGSWVAYEKLPGNCVVSANPRRVSINMRPPTKHPAPCDGFRILNSGFLPLQSDIWLIDVCLIVDSTIFPLIIGVLALRVSSSKCPRSIK